MMRRRGYSLIELFAVMAILTMLMASILPFVDSLGRAHREFLDSVAEEAALERATAILREDLREARGDLEETATFRRDEHTLILDRAAGPLSWKADEDRLRRIDPSQEGEGRSFLVAAEALHLERLGEGKLLRVKIARAIGRGGSERRTVMKRNERGWALMAAIGFMAILSVLAGTIWQVVATEYRQSSILRDRAAAEALAELARPAAAPAEKEFPLGEGLVRVAIRRDNDRLRMEATGRVGQSVATRRLDQEVNR